MRSLFTIKTNYDTMLIVVTILPQILEYCFLWNIVNDEF
jgi:hypothetical protein